MQQSHAYHTANRHTVNKAQSLEQQPPPLAEQAAFGALCGLWAYTQQGCAQRVAGSLASCTKTYETTGTMCEQTPLYRSCPLLD